MNPNVRTLVIDISDRESVVKVMQIVHTGGFVLSKEEKLLDAPSKVDILLAVLEAGRGLGCELVGSAVAFHLKEVFLTEKDILRTVQIQRTFGEEREEDTVVEFVVNAVMQTYMKAYMSNVYNSMGAS